MQIKFYDKLKKGGICLGLLGLMWASQPVQAQLFDPQNSLILNTLREIAMKHNFALEEQRYQTAKLVQQLRQFYDTYTLLRSDVEFSQSLYRDFKALENLDLTRSYSLSNFIINGDRLDYYFPSVSRDVNMAAMDAEALVKNVDQLKKTYESFALSVDDNQVPNDAEQRRHNALAGQQAYSEAMFEYAMKCQILAKTYDSLAVELNQQIMNRSNQYTTAERTQFLLEAVKLRDLSNSYYEKYLNLSEKAHENELNLYDEKLNYLQSKVNWKALKNQVNATSKIRYGFFDLVPAPFK
ncbi:hypothetical protein L0128_20115 [candidate division KSB1 bacterium]|nr:hypothetical protein [candidate division KSB1 bacterium]